MKKQIIQLSIFPIVMVLCFWGFAPSKEIIPIQLDKLALEEYDSAVRILAMNELDPNAPVHITTPFLKKSFHGFKDALGFKESQNRYNVVNQFGYLGKYQFGKETLAMIGINNPIEFLDTPSLQEKALIANLKRNKWILRRDIERFSGKTINGVLVTESGTLAAAHLAGPGSVKKYLRSWGQNGFNDAFGTSIRSYMKKFAAMIPA